MAGGPAPYPVPRRSRAVTALIAAAVVLVSIIGIGIVSAVAIPVFLSQRMKAEWRSTTIALPATFDGGEREELPASLVPEVLTGADRDGADRRATAPAGT